MDHSSSAKMKAIMGSEAIDLKWGKVVYEYIPFFVDHSHKLIINGDDFGMNNSINTAFIKSLKVR